MRQQWRCKNVHAAKQVCSEGAAAATAVSAATIDRCTAVAIAHLSFGRFSTPSPAAAAAAIGTLSVQEFLAIPELEHNPLVNRVVHTFDSDKSGEVDFREFVTALSVFATHAQQQENSDQKYRFTFKVYDVDNDGYISNADLYHVSTEAHAQYIQQ